MPTITVQPSGKVIEAAAGVSLLQALKSAGEAIAAGCEGKAECGKCHLFVTEGRKSLTRTTREENAKLDSIVGVSSKSRLACQAFLGDENISVELLGFA